MGRVTGAARLWAIVLLLATSLVAACRSYNRTTDLVRGGGGPNGQFPVAVSLPIFVSLVEAVGGERVTVTSIVPVGADPHTYQPTPSNVQAVADAGLVFVNGAGLEDWLQPLLVAAGGTKIPVYELAEGLQTIEEDAHAADAGHDHAEGNPHLWLDPFNAISYVRQIAYRLSERDPDGAAEYKANADRYVAEIEEFDRWAKEQIARIPPDRRKLVTFHDAYPYFAAHYGLELVGVILPNPGREPSPREMAQLVDTIREQQVPAIFIEPQFNPRLAERIAQEAGARTYLLYSDSPPEGGGYLDMMRANIEQLVEGLGE